MINRNVALRSYEPVHLKQTYFAVLVRKSLFRHSRTRGHLTSPPKDWTSRRRRIRKLKIAREYLVEMCAKTRSCQFTPFIIKIVTVPRLHEVIICLIFNSTDRRSNISCYEEIAPEQISVCEYRSFLFLIYHFLMKFRLLWIFPEMISRNSLIACSNVNIKKENLIISGVF